jgi:glutathione S-transferase
MKLYYAPGACSLAPHIVAREARLRIDLDQVTLGPQRTTQSGKDYLTINPKGSVPALQLDNGEVLTENAVLLQYLAALKPSANLAPTEGMARWRFVELLNFIATELHKGFSPLFNPKLTPEWRAAVIEKLNKNFGLLNATLGAKAYLTGETFTVADAYAFTILRWADRFKVDLTPWPNLVAFIARVAAREGVKEALAHEGLLQAA